MTVGSNNTYLLEFNYVELNPTLGEVTILVPQHLTNVVYEQATRAQQALVEAPGFAPGKAPIHYIQSNYRSMLLEHVKEFLFKYFVINCVYRELRTRKILTAGHPRSIATTIDPLSHSQFIFHVTVIPTVELQEWRYFPFKAPKRKKYKDLDRQVESFINDEKKSREMQTNETVAIGDWVSFDIFLVNDEQQPLFPNHKENLWLKIGDEEADAHLRDIFIGKQVNDVFFSSNAALQEFFSDHINGRYTFCVTVVDIVHNAFFCIDSFKKYFKLKTNKEVYQKLVEVFSYRNDLSQRRSMVEETFKLLLNKHRFTVPNHLILRQKTVVLNTIQSNPDYHVYRVQKDFMERVRQLAEKQAKEELIIDQIAFQEHIEATPADIKTYLNLIKRPRTKEFVYFTPPASKIRGQEVPIFSEELKIACTREKTLNHIIYHLTQK